MSTDRKRLTSAIQRIAREDPEIRKLLDDFRNSGGKPSESATSGSGAEDRKICCDGSTNPNPNPGTDQRDPTDGDQDGLDHNDPANLGGLDGGSLTGVTDCATGEPICFDGDGFIPPDGWDDPASPPLDPTYEEGFFWRISYNGEDYTGATKSIAFGKASADGARDDCLRCPEGTTREVVFPLTPIPDDGSGCPGAFYCGGSDAYAGGAAISYQRVECPSPQDPLDCDPGIEDITIDTWPSDGCVNLAVKSGTIVGSKYDPENGGSYSAPRTSIDLCDGNGNQISLAPAANGGWKTINSTTDNGYLYDSSGQQIAHIDGNEYSDPSV